MKYTKNKTVVLDTLKELNDIVVPTMGAKGMLAIIDEAMDRPTMTDDGVTVVKQCKKMSNWGKVIASGAIEAAHNTERTAYDGTTLTVMMVYELYKKGYELIKKGMHPQRAANVISDEVEKIIEDLRASRLNLEEYKIKDIVRDVATISTKIPELGNIIAGAFDIAGKDMNVMVEHDRMTSGIHLEHVKGYSIGSGYMIPDLRTFCNIDGDVTEYDNARIAIMKEGMMTTTGIAKFFSSIPKDKLSEPIVFITDPSFNPEALRIILDTVVKNSMKCQFIFMNEPQVDDLYQDIATITEGKLHDTASGIKEYLWEHCGIARHIKIEMNKSLIVGAGDASMRIKDYKRKLREDKFQLPESLKVLFESRLSSLTTGVTKIKVGVPTIVEFKTLKLKLDDGIGAVREALRRGIQIGGGKALYNLSYKYPLLKNAMQAPLKQICFNAGVPIKEKLLKKYPGRSYNVTTGELVDLITSGILDSSASIEDALLNAKSIACNYLKIYIIIREDN